MLYKSSPKKRVHFTQQICRDSHDSREIICNGKCLAMTWGTLLSMNGAKSRLNYTSRNPGVNTYESYDSSWEILGNIYIIIYIWYIIYGKCSENSGLPKLFMSCTPQLHNPDFSCTMCCRMPGRSFGVISTSGAGCSARVKRAKIYLEDTPSQ